MKNAAIIQARMGSSRLPGKVLAELNGVSVLKRVVNAAQAIPHLHDIIVATTDQTQDNVIESWCKDHHVRCYRGSEQNVLERYYEAAQKLELKRGDMVMRLTADCPLLDPQVCGEVLSMAIRTGADYANNIGSPRMWPDGLDCEVFTFEALEKSFNEAQSDLHKEHVTLYIRQNPKLFECLSMSCPVGGIGDYRWTLDTADDLKHIRALMDEAEKTSKPSKTFRPYTDFIRAEESLHADYKLGNRFELEQSLKHLPRALKHIPGASQTFSKSYIQHIEGVSPFFLERGKGAYVWDVDGNHYIDYLSALLPVLLGYCDDEVDESIKAQLSKGISFSLATRIEAELAEMLCDMIPCAEMIRFAKNGSDVTSGAIRLARAFTGRDNIAICGYHGWHDWYIGTTAKDKGVPADTKKLSDTFNFNDIESLKKLLAQKKYAAIILEPEGTEKSRDNFLEDVRKLATEHGAVLVFDEIVSGFRSALGGIQELRSVVPDLACFGKAMGNGMPISAIAGRAEIMRVMDNIFFSGTFGGETLSIAASIACLNKYKRIDGVTKINALGAKIKTEINKILKQQNIGDILKIGGESWWPAMIVTHEQQAIVKTLIRQELAKNGIIQGNGFNISAAHTDDIIQTQTMNAWENIALSLATYLSDKDPARFLATGQPMQSFQVRKSS